MIISFSELCEKEVINCVDGRILGNVSDIDINTDDCRILSLTVCQSNLFSKQPSFKIRLECVEKIGKDTIIVNYNTPERFCEKPEKKEKRKLSAC